MVESSCQFQMYHNITSCRRPAIATGFAMTYRQPSSRWEHYFYCRTNILIFYIGRGTGCQRDFFLVRKILRQETQSSASFSTDPPKWHTSSRQKTLGVCFIHRFQMKGETRHANHGGGGLHTSSFKWRRE